MATDALRHRGRSQLGTRPTVSVVIPTCNCARYLPEAIDSVLAQTYRDFEIIVVDDGSMDNTQEVLARYGDRTRAIRQPNQGRSAARNAGILAARGEYIAFLDADDLWLPQKLDRQMTLFQAQSTVGWVYSDYRFLDEGGVSQSSFLEKANLRPPPHGAILPDLLGRGITWTSTVVARTECLLSAGLFDITFPVAEDYEMWLRLASRADVGCVDEVLALYRRHAASVTALNPANESPFSLYHRWRVCRKFIRECIPQLQPGLRRRATAIAHANAAGHAARLGEVFSSRGERWKARRWLLRALATALVGPVNRAELVPRCLGRLLDTSLPGSVMEDARRLKRRIQARAWAWRARPRQVSASPTRQPGVSTCD